MRRDHGKDPLRDLVAARDAPEDVDEDALHLGVREHDLERRAPHRFPRAAADIEEVRGVPAGALHRVERRHDQAGAVADDPNVAVELDVAEAERASAFLDLLVGRDLLPVAQLGLTKERVVVNVELRVAGEDGAVGLDEKRVDLHEHRVGARVDAIQARRDVRDGVPLRRGNAGVETQRPRLVGKESDQWIRPAARDLLGIFLGDLFDVHPADRRQHHHRTAAVAVERDAEIELTRDLRGALDEHLSNAQSLYLHVEDRRGVLARLGRCLRDLDAAGLPASADVHLRFHHDRTAVCPRGRLRLLMRRRETTLRDWDAGAREELLGLVLVELHGGGTEDIVASREARFGHRYNGQRQDHVRARAERRDRRRAYRARRAVLGARLEDRRARDIPLAHPVRDLRRGVGRGRQLSRGGRARARVVAGGYGRLARLPASARPVAALASDRRADPRPCGALAGHRQSGDGAQRVLHPRSVAVVCGPDTSRTPAALGRSAGATRVRPSRGSPLPRTTRGRALARVATRAPSDAYIGVMATVTAARPAALPRVAELGVKFDWLVVAASAWLGAGLYWDGWAHGYGLPDSFWTIWHAAFYSGFAACAAVILGGVARNRPNAATWRAAIPA